MSAGRREEAEKSLTGIKYVQYQTALLPITDFLESEHDPLKCNQVEFLDIKNPFKKTLFCYSPFVFNSKWWRHIKNPKLKTSTC